MAFAALIYLAIAAILFRNLLPVLTTHLFGDPGDPLLNVSILAWNAKHLPLTDAWWNFPAFAPFTGVTAFTEHFLGAYPLTTPIIWMTGNPVLAYNVLELACFTLNGVAAYALVRELTTPDRKGPRLRAGAFFAGLAFAFAPFVGEHATHVQMLMAFGMPVALLGLHRYLADGRRSDLVWFALGWFEVLLSNAYLLVFFPILVALWSVWFFRRADLRRWRAIAATAVAATLPVVPLLIGYVVRQRAYGFRRSVDEIAAFSATWSSLLGISHRAVLWTGWLPNTFAEASLFPGFAIAALAIVGVATGRRRVVLFYFVAAVAMWLLALGPVHGPYWLLLKLPGARSIRVPARAWSVATVCLAVCAGYGAAWLASRDRIRWLLVPIALMIVAEAWFAGPLVAAPAQVPLYLPNDATVLDLPITTDFRNADAQYRAVMSNYRVVNGYSGYFPPGFVDLANDINAHRSAALLPFRRRGDLYVIARGNDVDPSVVTWLEMQVGVERVTQLADWKVYRLPAIR